jgi:hypothetical protein
MISSRGRPFGDSVARVAHIMVVGRESAQEEHNSTHLSLKLIGPVSDKMT